jgi:hypothetical protein
VNLNFTSLKNQETFELMKGLFDSLNVDENGRVLFTDLVDHLISIGVDLDPILFTRAFKKHLKIDSITNTRVCPTDFHSMLFESKKTEKILEVLRKQLKQKRSNSLLPKIYIKNVSSYSPTPFKFSRLSESQPEKIQDFRKLIQSWWNSLSPLGDEEVSFNRAAQFLIEKEIVVTLYDAKKIFNTTSSSISKDDFFTLFCIPITKLQVLDAAKKINQISETSPFLSAYQKLSSVKRKLLISRISPDHQYQEKEQIDLILNGIINYRTRIKSVLK